MVDSQCSRAWRRTREGNDLWHECRVQSHLIPVTIPSPKAALVYGQMNETAGRPPRRIDRLGRGKILQDEENQDVLLFVDNIFRFYPKPDPGICVARPHAVRGRVSTKIYPTGMGALQRKDYLDEKGSITSVASHLRPCRRLDRPGARLPRLPRMDATTVLSRQLAELGIYPAVDPLDSTSRILDPQVIGENISKSRAVYNPCCSGTKDLQDIIAILGMDEHPEDDKMVVAQAKDSTVPVIALPRRRSLHRCTG